MKACPTSQPADAICREPEAPLPIDWEVPTRGCKLAINGTSSELGYLNIANARIRNFLQPAIFPEEIEIWLPGSRSEIGWLQFKGDPQKEPSKKHPFEHNTNDWDSPTNLYNIDLVIGKDNEIVRNVMSEYFVRMPRLV